MVRSGPLDTIAEALGKRAVRSAPLASLTTYRLGGPAALLLTAESEADVSVAAVALADADPRPPVLVIGNGSNLLIADRGFDGLVVIAGAGLSNLDFDPAVATARAGSGVSLPVLGRRTAAAGLTGLEWAVGVPGTVGGAVRMNAGGHGSQTSETVRSVRLVDLDDPLGAPHEVEVSGLAFGYRSSGLRPEQVVTEATFHLRPGNTEQSMQTIAEIVRWRRQHQPGGRNAGSVFVNPLNGFAGALIDDVGLRGLRIGSAQVSEKHANFLQCDDGGSATDVLALIIEVRRRVADQTGVVLVPEVRLAGFREDELAGLS